MLFEKVPICLIFKRTDNAMTELYHSTPIQPSMNQYDINLWLDVNLDLSKSVKLMNIVKSSWVSKWQYKYKFMTLTLGFNKLNSNDPSHDHS